MLPLAYARHWQAASIVLLALVLLLTIMPAVWFWSDRVAIARWFDDIDKWAHGGTFLLLSLWFAGQYRKNAYWRVALGLLAFGVLIELCQRFVSYRSAEVADVVADGAGIAIGLALALAGAGGWCVSVENWYRRRLGAAGD